MYPRSETMAIPRVIKNETRYEGPYFASYTWEPITPARLPNPLMPRMMVLFPGSVDFHGILELDLLNAARGLPGVFPLSQATVRGAET